MNKDDLDDDAGIGRRPSCRYYYLLAASLGLVFVLVFGIFLLSNTRSRGIPIECFETDVGLTEEEFRAKHGDPEQVSKSGDQTMWLYNVGLGGWHSVANVVVFDKNH